jgi:hypothetical protein
MLKRSPVRSCSSSVAMCCEEAGPAEAMLISPGRALTRAAISIGSAVPKAGWATSSSGTITTLVMAAKSRSGS